MKSLLFEIGTEEIPAGYISSALEALAGLLLKKLEDHRIAYEAAKTYGTPRRLAVMVSNVADRQKTVVEEMMGPPERVAFDQSGTALVPALKFAEKTGIPPARLYVKDTEKGRYVFAEVTRKGQAVRTVLKTILPEVIRSLPFPKTMRWGTQTISFARPIQSIVCILGKEPVVFELGNIRSGRHTFGHRFMSPGKIKITAPETYVDQLSEAYVMADIELRRKVIEQEVIEAAEGIKGKIVPDSALLDTVTQLVEFPAVAVGRFDEKFLMLPDEILITSMREHQKYFAVSGQDGKLKPNFIVVNNTPAKDMALVVKGHERVLRARLEDAMFFYKKDIAAPFDQNVEKLKDVLFQAKLGTLYDKTVRVRRIAGFIADLVKENSSDGQLDPNLKEDVEAAAWLCKADLVSHVVVEFPKLQGIMGRIYAGLGQKPQNVSLAVEEHYRPVYSGAPLPETVTGAILAIADKVDNLCGCFSVGFIPSGASDPYALRRQGIGIIQILLSRKFGISLNELVSCGLGFYIENDPEKKATVSNLISNFLIDRISNLLAEEGYSKDVIAAVIAVSAENIPILWKKIAALEELKKAPDFEPLAAAFKRVVNIIKKSDTAAYEHTAVRPELFEHPCEGNLLSAFENVHQTATVFLEKQDYKSALQTIASLKKPVDDFFDGVLVMSENPGIRNNRFALLTGIARLFETVADFSKLSTP